MINTQKLKLLVTFLSIYFYNYSLEAQINWTIYEETLSPDVIQIPGSIKLNKTRDLSVEVTGTIQINFPAKSIYFSDGRNTLLIDNSDYELVKIFDIEKGDQKLEQLDVFSKNIKSKYYKKHIINLYQKLDLNKITYSTSNKSEYGVDEDNKILIKNEKKMESKIIAISPTSVEIITATGQTIDLSYSDFNYIEFNGKRYVSILELYSEFYNDFRLKQMEVIDTWENNIKGMTIDSLIEFFGPIKNIFNLADGRNIIVWEEKRTDFSIGLSNISSSMALSKITEFSNASTYSYFNSPIFYYYSYYSKERNINVSQYSLGTNRTFGKIFEEDRSEKISIILDKLSKANSISHKNIFISPKYGQAFSFL